ncbi:MAG: hypothetical protein IPK73_12285 [Candidatus Obscuribacter sp.]|nr:hypothetical protein [Candidatus Obscuribacter sp.]MBK9281799.1 hypothetical protein [Candidatus Obscuribacter sp.]
MREGFFSIYYTGCAGTGLGLFALTKGSIVGVDAAGGIYDGDYESDDDKSPLYGVMRLTVPPGVVLVTGNLPENQPFTMNIPLELPADFATSQQPQMVQTSTGPVNLIIRKLRDLAPEKRDSHE